MAKELHKCLINYFSQLVKVDEKCKDLCRKTISYLNPLKCQSEQLRFVLSLRPPGIKFPSMYRQMSYCYSKEVNDAELCKIDELHGRLIFKILMGIDSELAGLSDILIQFNNNNQDLNNRLKNLEDARSKVSLDDDTMKELINGTPNRPRLNLLLEWAVVAFDYYHEIYLLSKERLQQFNYKDDETIENLQKSFVEDRFKRARINRIIGFTQFLIKETAH